MTNADVNDDKSCRAVSEILRMISRIDRLRVLFALGSGRQTVMALTRMIHGDNLPYHGSQMSAALAPMRHVGLVKTTHQGRYKYYELTDFGREVLEIVSQLKVDRTL